MSPSTLTDIQRFMNVFLIMKTLIPVGLIIHRLPWFLSVQLSTLSFYRKTVILMLHIYRRIEQFAAADKNQSTFLHIMWKSWGSRYNACHSTFLVIQNIICQNRSHWSRTILLSFFISCFSKWWAIITSQPKCENVIVNGCAQMWKCGINSLKALCVK